MLVFVFCFLITLYLNIKIRNMKKYLLLPLVMLMIGSASVLANKTSVKVSVSDSTVAKGTEVTITINVTHVGNSNAHHTEWVYLKVNGKEVKRWEYGRNNLPANQNFTVEYKIKATENMSIEVEGNCNLHGTAGPATLKITVS